MIYPWYLRSLGLKPERTESTEGRLILDLFISMTAWGGSARTTRTGGEPLRGKGDDEKVTVLDILKTERGVRSECI